MLQKKKVTAKKSTDIASPKALRNVAEYIHTQANEAADLITSSVRKQKFSRSVLKTEGCVATIPFNVSFGLVKDDTSTTCIDNDVNIECYNDSVENKGLGNNLVHEGGVTLFSPFFQSSRTLGGEIANGDFLKYFHHETAAMEQDMLGENIIHDMNFNDDNNLAHSDLISKLDCVNEYDQEHEFADVEEEIEELEFNPYFCIMNLPDLSSVVPDYRPVILPKRTRRCPLTTLVLDLDETLVHSTMEPCEGADFTFSVKLNEKKHSIYVRCRPHLREFMDRIYGLFEIVIFTASQSIYAQQLLNILDPKRKVFRYRVYRDSCVNVDGNYVKDLTVLGRDLARVAIIDNSPQAFGYQIDNGIPIESWFDDKFDEELISLLPFLESLVGVEDVRPLIADKFNLRKKIAAAATHFRTRNKGSYN